MRCRSIRSEHRLFRQQARGVTKILQERAHLCAVKRNGNRERLATLRSGRANCCVRQLVDWERDCLMRELPDRKHRAEDDQRVDQYLQHVALTLFRTNQQSVGRFKVCIRFGLIVANCLCNARAKISIVNLSRWQ